MPIKEVGTVSEEPEETTETASSSRRRGTSEACPKKAGEHSKSQAHISKVPEPEPIVEEQEPVSELEAVGEEPGPKTRKTEK